VTEDTHGTALPEAGPEAQTGTGPESETGTGPAPRRRVRPLVLTCVLLIALAGSLFVPEVRTTLRQSFTRMPQPVTAIYFTADPKIQGTVLNVPITVDGKDTGISTYQVKVWTVTAAGRVDARTDAKVPQVKGVNTAVITLTIAPDAAVVWVSLDGTDQVIHFKIA
jgi:hypothetical protein